MIDTDMADDDSADMGDASENINQSYLSTSTFSPNVRSPKKSFINLLNALTSNARPNPMRMLDPNETFNTDKSFSVHETEMDGKRIIFQDFCPLVPTPKIGDSFYLSQAQKLKKVHP